uniref:Uncharacterized protein n=1 Tax=Clytia hemisphaerica TaxID=252671 RepID=A0A7M5XJ24_9CNID
MCRTGEYFCHRVIKSFILYTIIFPSMIKTEECKIISQQAVCNMDRPLNNELWADIHVVQKTHLHKEIEVPLTKLWMLRLEKLLTECTTEKDSLCNMQIPDNIYTVKFHIERNLDGTLKILGIYMKNKDQIVGKDRPDDAVRVTFLVKDQAQRFQRSRPQSNFHRVETTPDGLVVIGVIRPTRKSVTKNLGVLKVTSKPSFKKKLIGVGHLFVKVSKNHKKSMAGLMKKVVDGFASAKRLF